VLNQVLHELRRSYTIDQAVIARQAQSQAGSDCRLTIHGYNSVFNGAYGENRRLRWSDDSGESVNVEHAEIADREGSVGEIGGSKLAIPGAL
jgi:hypothetical protein